MRTSKSPATAINSSCHQHRTLGSQGATERPVTSLRASLLSPQTMEHRLERIQPVSPQTLFLSDATTSSERQCYAESLSEQSELVKIIPNLLNCLLSLARLFSTGNDHLARVKQ